MKCDFCIKNPKTFPNKGNAPSEKPETNPSWNSFIGLNNEFGIHFCPIDWCENSKINTKLEVLSIDKLTTTTR